MSNEAADYKEGVGVCDGVGAGLDRRTRNIKPRSNSTGRHWCVEYVL